uniref:Putative secreted protein n=1 Tax=Anopheles darlingi TaxID=43151 RepID=A0A2M4DAQ7_ANODA
MLLRKSFATMAALMSSSVSVLFGCVGMTMSFDSLRSVLSETTPCLRAFFSVPIELSSSSISERCVDITSERCFTDGVSGAGIVGAVGFSFCSC